MDLLKADISLNDVPQSGEVDDAVRSGWCRLDVGCVWERGAGVPQRARWTMGGAVGAAGAGAWRLGAGVDADGRASHR